MTIPPPSGPMTNGQPTPGPSSRPESPPLPLEPNVKEVVLGDLWIKPWFPSFYPEELVGRECDRLYVCKWCFKYTVDLAAYLGHTKVCDYRDEKLAEALGGLIYEAPSQEGKGEYAILEVDGEESKLYTQNLSLFAKLFLDTKSVFYDVTTFLYYLLVYTDRSTRTPRSQVVGFFSKEKLSWDNNNLACILVFPPWQKRGLGQILMAVSYELSKREGRLGGPEKPLSELGRCAYIHFWAGTIARYIVASPAKKTITVKQISDDEYIMTDDIITTLKEMQVLEHQKKGSKTMVINKAAVRAWAEANRVSLENPVDRDAFMFAYESVVEEDDEDELG